MIVADLNLLLYAINRDSEQHTRAKAWLERTFVGEEPVALAWVVILGFLRLVTSARVFAQPLTVEEAISVVEDWLGCPAVVTLSPGPEHWRTLEELLREVGTAGNLTTDVHLAALAIEHGAILHSTDADFGRFRHLRWTNPLV